MATATLAPETGTAELYRMPLDLYRRIAELGLLGPSDRVELLDGLLVKKMTRGPRHATVTSRASKRLERLLPEGWTVRTESPVELPSPRGDSAPEPDIVIIRGHDDDYEARHPTSDDIVLVVEVADSSLSRDRRGLARYAWAGIPSAWIANLNKDEIEVYTEPSGPTDDPGYARRETFRLGSTLNILLNEREVVAIAVDDLLH